MLECGHDKPPQFPLLKHRSYICETACTTNGQGEYAQLGLTANRVQVKVLFCKGVEDSDSVCEGYCIGTVAIVLGPATEKLPAWKTGFCVLLFSDMSLCH